MSNANFDLATMALKGKRYDQAENAFQTIAVESNSAEAWTGLGICKIYQLADGRTMDEAIFCFDKAKQINPEISNDIEKQLIITSQIVINEYMKIYDNSLAKYKEQRKQANTGLIIAGASAILGSGNNNSTLSSLTSLATMGAGVGVAVSAFSKMDDIKEIQEFILEKCNEIDIGINNYVDNKSTDAFIQYSSNKNNVVEYLNELQTKTSNGIWSKNKKDGIWWENRNLLILITIFVWPVGLYGWYMRSKN